MPQDQRDPRCNGGPCKRLHATPLTPRLTAFKDLNKLNFAGNPMARYVACATCGLRVMYYPKKSHTGAHSVVTNPAVVTEAMMMLEQEGKLHLCTTVMMDAAIQQVKAQIKTDAVIRGGAAKAKRKAKVKPKANAQPFMQSTPNDEEYEEETPWTNVDPEQN
jgi:hypothetical protein